MANFEVLVLPVEEVKNHPNADRLSIVVIAGFIAISAKLEDGSHRYKKDDRVIFVPENAIVPDNLLKMGFWNESKNCGVLAGPNGNRVKPVRLRGIMSDGIMFPVTVLENEQVSVGTNVAEILGIKKWEPEIPASMAGDVFNLGQEHIVKYDIENLIKMRDHFTDDIHVSVTEKIHGTNMQIIVVDEKYSDPENGFFDGRVFVTSKGLGAKGLVFKNNENNRIHNVYVRQLLKMEENKLDEWAGSYNIIGELFGPGVQDLKYGLSDVAFRMFDVFDQSSKSYYSAIDHKYIANSFNLQKVPSLYIGPFDWGTMDELRKGMSTFDENQIREGIVIKPIMERSTLLGDRLIAKYINPAYHERKGGTEFN